MKRTAKQAAAVDAVAEAKRRILETLDRMPWTTGKRPPFVPADVRRESGLSKDAFDRAAVALLREGIIYMAEHDHAGRLTDAERAELVYGGERESEYFPGIMRPVYYCSISLRGLHSWHRQPDGTWAPGRAARTGQPPIPCCNYS